MGNSKMEKIFQRETYYGGEINWQFGQNNRQKKVLREK